MQPLDSDASPKRNGILYPLLLIAAIALIIFSVVGIATMTGLIPGAFSRNDVVPAEPISAAPPLPASTPAPFMQQAPAARPARATAQNTIPPRMAAAECNDCGVVESMHAVQVTGQGSGLGAVAGGVLGGVLGNQVGHGRSRAAATVVGAGGGAYAGHEIEKKMNKTVGYQVRVRMNDGTYRTFQESSQPALSVGQKVRVTNGAIVTAG